MLNKETASRLAVAYDAFHTAADKEENNAASFWAKELIEAQKDTGITLNSVELLESYIIKR